jgi:hypothetical protein
MVGLIRLVVTGTKTHQNDGHDDHNKTTSEDEDLRVNSGT